MLYLEKTQTSSSGLKILEGKQFASNILHIIQSWCHKVFVVRNNGVLHPDSQKCLNLQCLHTSVFAKREKSLQKGICCSCTPPRVDQANRSVAEGQQFPSLFPTTIFKYQEREKVVEESQGSE